MIMKSYNKLLLAAVLIVSSSSVLANSSTIDEESRQLAEEFKKVVRQVTQGEAQGKKDEKPKKPTPMPEGGISSVEDQQP